MKPGPNLRRGMPSRRAFSMPNLKQHETSVHLCKSPEIAFDVLSFLDRFSVDAVEISSRFFYDLIGENVERLAWRSLQQAQVSYSKEVNEVYICGVIPVDPGALCYRRRQSAVRSIVKSFEKLRLPECFEFSMSALILSHVDYLVINNYYMLREITRIISQSASWISVKDLYCCSLLRPPGPAAFDSALFYSAFDRFDDIQSITCSSCSIEVENELRNLCLAKQIAFSTI